MSSLIHFIFLVVISISLSTYNVLGSPPRVRAKRMLNSRSDTNNFIRHEARLEDKAGGNCTGSIISDTHVLTAAHCVIAKNASDITKGLTEVTVGITMVDHELEFQTVRLVKTVYTLKYFFHPIPKSYDEVYHMTGDIAVLELNYRLGLGVNYRIEPLRLPTKQYEINEKPQSRAKNLIMFAGFGYTRVVNDSQSILWKDLPDYLQYSLAEVLPPCSILGDAKGKMCATLLLPDATTCNGDSGGALFDLEKKTILGVLSYGAGDASCSPPELAVYTSVFHFVPFIKRAMDDNPDLDMRRLSFESNDDYIKALKADKYYRIWTPELHTGRKVTGKITVTVVDPGV